MQHTKTKTHLLLLLLLLSQQSQSPVQALTPNSHRHTQTSQSKSIKKPTHRRSFLTTATTTATLFTLTAPYTSSAYELATDDAKTVTKKLASPSALRSIKQCLKKLQRLSPLIENQEYAFTLYDSYHSFVTYHTFMLGWRREKPQKKS